MRRSALTPGILIALIVLLAAILILVIVAIRSNSAAYPSLALRRLEPLVKPVVKDIDADRGWQNTGILIEAGQTIHIQFMSGEIRDGDAIIRGPGGAGWACGDPSCCEPMPAVDRDALIGRIGDAFFPIGDKSEITVSAGGELQLRINDCDAGLADNSGALTIQISP